MPTDLPRSPHLGPPDAIETNQAKNMQTALELPKSLYDQASRAAGLEGVSVEEYITRLLEEKLRSEQPPTRNKQRISVPLVPSIHPGSRPLTADRVADILSDDDVSH
jgi:hypothetical protein